MANVLFDKPKYWSGSFFEISRYAKHMSMYQSLRQTRRCTSRCIRHTQVDASVVTYVIHMSIYLEAEAPDFVDAVDFCLRLRKDLIESNLQQHITGADLKLLIHPLSSNICHMHDY